MRHLLGATKLILSSHLLSPNLICMEDGLLPLHLFNECSIILQDIGIEIQPFERITSNGFRNARSDEL